MSPEQLFSPKDVGARSDLWSLAVVAYRALTGRLPFEGDSFGAVCVAINGGKYPKPTSLNPELPSELDAWFARVLTRRPSERFDNATDMANAYLSCLHAAGLLPSWALRRSSGGPDTLSSFATDPGGISGGPITLPRHATQRKSGRVLTVASVCLLGGLGWAVATDHLPPMPAQLSFLNRDRLLQLVPANWRPAPMPQLAAERAPVHPPPAEAPSALIVIPHTLAAAIPDPARVDVGETGSLPSPSAPRSTPLSAGAATAAVPVEPDPSPAPGSDVEPSPYDPPPAAAPSPPRAAPSTLDPVGRPANDPLGI